MKQVYLYIFLFLRFGLHGQTYVQLDDHTGFDRDRYQTELNTAAQELVAVFKDGPNANLENEFKVFDFGFYLHKTKIKDGVPEAFEQAKVIAARKSPYYLLFGKQSDENGLYSEFLVDLKLPENFSPCLTATWESILKEQLEGTVNKVHSENKRNVYLYANAEIAAIQELKTSLDKLIGCCSKTNARSSETCTLCALQTEGMKTNLENAGFLMFENATVEIDSILSLADPQGYINLDSDFRIRLSNHGYTWDFTKELEEMLGAISGSTGRVLYFNEENCNEFEAIYGPINPTGTAARSKNNSIFSEEIIVLDFDGVQQVFFKFSKTTPLESFEKWLLRHITIDNESGATYFFTSLIFQKCFANYDFLEVTFNDDVVSSWSFFKNVFEEARKANEQSSNQTDLEQFFKNLFFRNSNDYTFNEIKDIFLIEKFFNYIKNSPEDFKDLAKEVALFNGVSCDLCINSIELCLDDLKNSNTCSYKFIDLTAFLKSGQTNLNLKKELFLFCPNGENDIMNLISFLNKEGVLETARITILEDGDINLNDIKCAFGITTGNQKAVFSIYFTNDSNEKVLEFASFTLSGIMNLAEHLGFGAKTIYDCLYLKFRTPIDLAVENGDCDKLDALLTGFQTNFIKDFFSEDEKYEFLETLLNLDCPVDVLGVNEKEIIISLLNAMNDKVRLFTYLSDAKRTMDIANKISAIPFVGDWVYTKQFAKIIAELCQEFWADNELIDVPNFVYQGTVSNLPLGDIFNGKEFIINAVRQGDNLNIKCDLGVPGIFTYQSFGNYADFTVHPLSPVRFYVYPSEEGIILPAIAAAAIGWEGNNQAGMTSLSNYLNLLGFYGSARILLSKNTGTLLRLLALVDIGNIAINQAIQDPEIRAELLETESGRWFLDNWSIISIALDVGSLSGSLIDGLVRNGPMAADIMRYANKEDAARKLMNCIGNACFIAGTLIHTPYGLKPIETMKEGDIVIGYDFLSKDTVLSRISKTFKRKAGRLLKIILKNDSIITTPEHLFYTSYGWKPAKKLKTGNNLVSINKTNQVINKLIDFDSLSIVYNFEVEQSHNYFVSKKGILVHNSYAAIVYVRKYNYNGKKYKVGQASSHESWENLYAYRQRYHGDTKGLVGETPADDFIDAIYVPRERIPNAGGRNLTSAVEELMRREGESLFYYGKVVDGFGISKNPRFREESFKENAIAIKYAREWLDLNHPNWRRDFIDNLPDY